MSASSRAKVVFPLPVEPTTETRLIGSRRYPRSHPVKLHEYQAKQLLARAGIPIPEGRLATTHEEAEAAARALGGTVVVKAQVHVGGRGKAGGIKVAKNPAEAREHASTILHMQIKGLRVRKVYVERAAQIASELYLGITLDRDRRRPVVMLSTVGGMDIEEVAEKEPDKIARGWPDPLVGLLPYQARALCFDAGVPAAQRNAVADIASRLYGVYARTDAMLVEINPLFIQTDGSVIAGDAKLEMDDNALFRQTELRDWKEISPDEEVEERARALGFSFVQLDGDVGIIGNGAGLVMATLDAVQSAGGTCGELPRRRRRREGIGGALGARDRAREPQGEERPHQHLRRHHARRRGREGDPLGDHDASAERSARHPVVGHRGRGGPQAARRREARVEGHDGRRGARGRAAGSRNEGGCRGVLPLR